MEKVEFLNIKDDKKCQIRRSKRINIRTTKLLNSSTAGSLVLIPVVI